MMAALDGEISGTERSELDRLLASDEALREEWERMNRVRAVTGAMSLRRPPEEVWGNYWTSVYHRVERGVGWILASVGAILLFSYAAWQVVSELTSDPSVPALVKAGLLALAVGFVILFVSVLREKLFTRSRDPYKEIER
jgi:ferric-dicitrate binding protein FerR (iron transport regulator)